MNQSVLKLIQLVNNTHQTQELAMLHIILKHATFPSWLGVTLTQESIVCGTTLNSNHNYRLHSDPKYQDPENHVDRVLEWLSMEDESSITT